MFVPSKYGDLSLMKKTITNALIAGVLIQASWFIMAAAIDISSIATYGIGGLPVTIIEKADTNKGDGSSLLDIPILSPEVIIPLDNIDNSVMILKTEKTEGQEPRKISPCYLRTFEDPVSKMKESLILGRTHLYYVDKTGNPALTEEGICHYGGDIFWF